MTPSTFVIGMTYISKWSLRWLTSSSSSGVAGFSRVFKMPCIIHEALVSPGWILEVRIITYFSILGRGSGFLFLFFLVKDFCLFNGDADLDWASFSFSLRAVLLSSYSGGYSGFLFLLVMYRYSTLFPASEWQRVYRLALFLVTCLFR